MPAVDLTGKIVVIESRYSTHPGRGFLSFVSRDLLLIIRVSTAFPPKLWNQIRLNMVRDIRLGCHLVNLAKGRYQLLSNPQSHPTQVKADIEYSVELFRCATAGVVIRLSCENPFLFFDKRCFDSILAGLRNLGFGTWCQRLERNLSSSSSPSTSARSRYSRSLSTSCSCSLVEIVQSSSPSVISAATSSFTLLEGWEESFGLSVDRSRLVFKFFPYSCQLGIFDLTVRGRYVESENLLSVLIT